MALKSAYDDLRQRTLEKIEGIWSKLCYLAERRAPGGLYRHWGFERLYGVPNAQNAFARAHQSLVGSILRMRVRLLREDLEQSSTAEGTTPVSYVRKLTAGLYRLLPSGCSKATESHLACVLKTLSALESHRQSGSRSASRPPPLDQ
jgi:hypothetical protein